MVMESMPVRRTGEQTGEVVQLDLRGLKCPLNWAHAKVRIERMRVGEILEVTIDDPRGARDIPRAAEAEGHAIVEARTAAAGVWIIRIEK